jgi:hypothetical protein
MMPWEHTICLQLGTDNGLFATLPVPKSMTIEESTGVQESRFTAQNDYIGISTI